MAGRSSGRGRASQRYLGSSRLGARVWGRRRKVRGCGRYYQCCGGLQRRHDTESAAGSGARNASGLSPIFCADIGAQRHRGLFGRARG
jgi:hypothetical protein